MRTLLDEILSTEPVRVHNTGNCGCHTCLQKNNTAGFSSPWRQRRHQPSNLFQPHATQCTCAGCQEKQETEYTDNHAHTYWRKRRKLRLGWSGEAELEEMEVIPPGNFSNVPNPVTSFFGQSPHQVLRRKPKTWRILPAISGLGWKMIDEKGNERIRYMRPNPRKKGTKQSWTHIGTGYWVVRDGQGNYLDENGRIVAQNIPFSKMTEDQKNKIHVVFSGIQRELE